MEDTLCVSVPFVLNTSYVSKSMVEWKEVQEKRTWSVFLTQFWGNRLPFHLYINYLHMFSIVLGYVRGRG